MLLRLARLLFVQLAYYAAIAGAIIYLSYWLEQNYEGRLCYYDDNPCMGGLSFCVVEEGAQERYIESSDSSGTCRFVGFNFVCLTLCEMPPNTQIHGLLLTTSLVSHARRHTGFQFVFRTLLAPLLLQCVTRKRGQPWSGAIVGCVSIKTLLWVILWGLAWTELQWSTRPGGLVHAYYWMAWEILFHIVPPPLHAASSPLHQACYDGNVSETSKLLEEGANPFASSVAWYSPKDMAVFASVLKCDKHKHKDYVACYDKVVAARSMCPSSVSKTVAEQAEAV